MTKFRDLNEINDALSLWYQLDYYDYDYDGGATIREELLNSGYGEDDIDSDLINDYVWDKISGDYDQFIRDTEVIMDQYVSGHWISPSDYFDYFDFDIEEGYYEGYVFSVKADFPPSFDSEDQREDAYEEIGKLYNLLSELIDLGWSSNPEFDDAFQTLAVKLSEIPVDDWEEPEDWSNR